MTSYDYIVVGSGLSGLYAALLAQLHGTVLLLTKATLDDSNTYHAQGGIAAAVAAHDSPELHVRDTLMAGAGLCVPEAVRILVDEGILCIRELIQLGVPFDRDHGSVALGMEGGHSVARVLHAGGDATGANLGDTLANRVRTCSRVDIRERHFLTDIAVSEGAARGVRAVDLSTGHVEEFAARWIILATGGAGQLFSHTTNPDVATGDGVAVAYRAGAAVADLEFFQFHPTALNIPGAPHFLISEAVRGEGAILRTSDGRRFMPDYDSRAELAPRDIVARSIVSEMSRTGEHCVYLDVRHVPHERIESRFPTITAACHQWGLDLARDLIPVAPAAHYFMGGIYTDLWGQTTVPGLFACGECGCTGVHGANRLASNSLLEAVVFAQRSVRRTVELDQSGQKPDHATGTPGTAPQHIVLKPTPAEGATEQSDRVPAPDLPTLQGLMWDSVGMVRSHASLESARRMLSSWLTDLAVPNDRPSHELANLTTLGLLMADAAFLRTESRGAHYRTDYPNQVDSWQRRIVLVANAGHPEIPTAGSIPLKSEL